MMHSTSAEDHEAVLFAPVPGIIKGDEIMVINGAIVSDLDMMFIESVLQEETSLCMMMRSATFLAVRMSCVTTILVTG